MDACFEIYVPSIVPLPGLERHDVVFEWGGELHPQTPVRHSWGPHVSLVETRVPEHMADRLAGRVDVESWLGLLAEGRGLDLHEQEVNGGDVDWGGEWTLERFLREQLSRQDSWAVCFMPGWEQLDKVAEGDVERVIRELRESLTWGSPSFGFLIWR